MFTDYLHSTFFITVCQVFLTKKLKEGEKMANLLIAEIKKQMYIRNWKNADLANATGYKLPTIEAFFTNKNDRQKSVAVEKAICKALNIPY